MNYLLFDYEYALYLT